MVFSLFFSFCFFIFFQGDNTPRTILIDGSPLIFRAHFGIESTLTNKDGVEVTAGKEKLKNSIVE